MFSFPKMYVLPEPSLFDENLCIYVKGLTSAVVTIYLTTSLSEGSKYESFANYKVSSQGTVNLTTDKSLCGSYVGLEPMGLIWGITPFPNFEMFPQFAIKDVTKPVCYHLHVLEQKCSLEECRNTKKCITSTTINRWFMAPGVRRISIRENGLVATLFLPPGNGPFPGLINLTGIVSSIVEHRSSLLASHGFASLAMAYIGVEDLPCSISQQLDFEYFEKAVNFMLENSNVLSDNGIGIVSMCYGVSLALAMATHLRGVRCVVAVNGSDVIAYKTKYKKRIWKDLMKDIDLSGFKPNRINEMASIIPRPSYNLEEHPNFSPFHLQHNISYLLVCGLDDKCVHSDSTIRMEQLLHKEKHPDFEVLKYEGVGHIINLPYMAYCKFFYQPGLDMNTYIANGGSLVSHSKSQIDCWQKTLSFLRDKLLLNIKFSSKL